MHVSSIKDILSMICREKWQGTKEERLVHEMKEKIRSIISELAVDCLPEPDRKERELVENGRLIAAIKHHRDRCYTSLADSKRVMDNYKQVVILKLSDNTNTNEY